MVKYVEALNGTRDYLQIEIYLIIMCLCREEIPARPIIFLTSKLGRQLISFNISDYKHQKKKSSIEIK
jgi:hypothetical protein